MMTNPPDLLTPASSDVSLFEAVRHRPGLLMLELAWRWLAGSFLWLMAGYEGWRIWTASLPRLHLIGLIDLSPVGLLEDPSQGLPMLADTVAVLQPQVERAAWGLAPLAIFLWVAAYALGRTAVMARFDASLPRRPWLLAEIEAARILTQLALAGLWGMLAEAVYHRFVHDQASGFLSCLLVAISVAALMFATPVRRTLQIATLLALVENRSLRSVLRRAWSFHRDPAVQPLRRAINRARLLFFVAGLVLTVVPAPVPFGPLLVAWWGLLTLPSLAAADAWRLSAIFAVLRALEAADPKAIHRGAISSSRTFL